MKVSDNTMGKRRRSIQLTSSHLKWIDATCKRLTKADCAEIIGITRTTLDMIVLRKSAKSETVDKIIKAMTKNPAKP